MANRVMGYVICGYNSVDNLMSEQSSPFRRWTTGSGAGSSYRQHEHRNMYHTQLSEGSSPIASPNGSNVARWSLGLEQLLADHAGATAFAYFLEKEFAAENIRFWWSCEKYNSTEDPDARIALANDIWQKYLAVGASEPVNVDSNARKVTADMMYQRPIPRNLFHQAQQQIFNVMKFDSYPRFLRSAEHARCARAQLQGLPAAYPPPDDHKLKKSASSVSERRRSGGASLLPWRNRSASRDRPEEPEARNNPADVVKCGQTALCRLVLPDGVRTVVPLEAPPSGAPPSRAPPSGAQLSVGQLVDRQLAKRNLRCASYDVLLKDGPPGSAPTTVDTSAPASCLGGREATVERRALVRMQLGGRTVCVRCAAARRLAHVLRPVLARYSHTPAHRTVLKDGEVVHPDTLMQDLDGARLQIVMSESGEWSNGTRADCDFDENSDADSNADAELALRLQEDARDDAQNGSTSKAYMNGTSAQSAARSLYANASSTSGKVQAVLYPGTSLHHHPPEFLDKLRETQRRKLAPAGAPPSVPSPPSPHTPPPLPPKPLRAPTVV